MVLRNLHDSTTTVRKATKFEDSIPVSMKHKETFKCLVRVSYFSENVEHPS